MELPNSGEAVITAIRRELWQCFHVWKPSHWYPMYYTRIDCKLKVKIYGSNKWKMRRYLAVRD